MIKKSADSSQNLHPLIHERWSPRAFDETFTVSHEDLIAILEAGRWSPSSMNYQPWRFIIGKRGEKKFSLITESLSGFNREWAPRASIFIVLLAVMVDDANKPRTQSLYDLGIASANMTLEANHRGLAVHQVGGFDQSVIKASFSLPETINPISILVLGQQTNPEKLNNEELTKREQSSRTRKSLDDLIITSD